MQTSKEKTQEVRRMMEEMTEEVGVVPDSHTLDMMEMAFYKGAAYGMREAIKQGEKDEQ